MPLCRRERQQIVPYKYLFTSPWQTNCFYQHWKPLFFMSSEKQQFKAWLVVIEHFMGMWVLAGLWCTAWHRLLRHDRGAERKDHSMLFLFTSVTTFDDRTPNILPSAGSRCQAINQVWGSFLWHCTCDWYFAAPIHFTLESVKSWGSVCGG